MKQNIVETVDDDDDGRLLMSVRSEDGGDLQALGSCSAHQGRSETLQHG